MNKATDIKYRLAAALKECMASTSFDDITVKQIAATCSVSRQTFYRNFADKYELVNWYFDRLLTASFQVMREGKTVKEGLVRKFAFIRQEAIFFAAAFRVDEQNCLKEHDFQMILDFYTSILTREQVLSNNDLLLLEMYCYASVYMTVKWLLAGMKMSDSDLADLMIAALPETLVKLFQTGNLLGV